MDKKLETYINPFLKGNEISKKDFENLFGSFDEEMMEIVIDFINKKDIEIVSKHIVQNQIFHNDKKTITSTNEELSVMYQRGNQLSLDALIQKNEKLVYSRVMKYRNIYKHDLSEDDLFQEGCIGLMRAIEKFDNSMGNKLTTYSTHWIDQAIMRAIADKGFTVRVPVHMFEKINKLNKVYAEMSTENLSYIETRDIAMEKMNINRRELDEMLVIYNNIVSISSLNIPVGSEGDTQLGDMIKQDVEKDIFEIVAIEQLKIDIREVLCTLSVREQEILSLRFGLEDDKYRTLEEVGKIFELTRERIRQIEAKALRRLRHPSRSKRLVAYLYD